MGPKQKVDIFTGSKNIFNPSKYKRIIFFRFIELLMYLDYNIN